MNVRDESNWDKIINWQLDMASKLYAVFVDRIKKFN